MIITLFESAAKAYITEEDIVVGEWDDIASLLMDFHRRDKKEDAPMFNLWSFNPAGAEEGRKYVYEDGEKTEKFNYIPNTIRRCAANTEGIWGLVLDCDAKLTMEQAIDEIAGLEYVLYSSFRHSLAQDKFRIVIPFTRMMTRSEFLLKRDDIKKCFPLVDTASFSQSQAIYMHSGPDPNIAIAFRGHGAMIDPDMFVSKVITHKAQPANAKPLLNSQKDAYAATVYETLMTCSNVNRSGNNEGILLCNIARSAGLSFEDFQQICSVVAREGSSLRTLDVQKQFWQVVGPDSKVRRETRDAFIESHGGKNTISKVFKRTKAGMEAKVAYLTKKLDQELRNRK